jgi:hypothetical protein
MLLIGSWSQVRDWLSLFTNQRVTNSTLCLTIIIYYDSSLIAARLEFLWQGLYSLASVK